MKWKTRLNFVFFPVRKEQQTTDKHEIHAEIWNTGWFAFCSTLCV